MELSGDILFFIFLYGKRVENTFYLKKGMYDTIRNNRVFFCIHLKDDCLSVWFPQGLSFGKV